LKVPKMPLKEIRSINSLTTSAGFQKRIGRDRKNKKAGDKLMSPARGLRVKLLA
jgi:hypothetical protein